MTKTKQLELDVDFIGTQEPLTAEEQQKISDFFAHQKEIKTRSKSSKKAKKEVNL